MHELREELSVEDFLEMELSQDSDHETFPAVTTTSFSLKTGT
jgi:hypothetical protein